ncbi:hypothetical protein GGR53DRAFT_497880 [Hypoxylon sp. FL1150]|nr:hypothetical protein GGR53DRAFT_497880 [Hypoxylon sp. FL1150]
MLQPWSRSLRDFLNSVEDSSVYRFIYKKSCKQENMSMTLEVFHPDFDLLMEDELPPEAYMSREKPLPENRPAENPLLERRPFPFERLPPAIQAKIFGLVYIRRDLVHCLSRLDPFVPPSDFPADDEKNQSQLPKRFHFGTSPCQIRRARRPNDVLKPLLVCKRWFFIGVHAFYGANTFAFSSLGEFHRFCNGIGEARVERIVNVEIMWHGALMPPQNPQVSERSIGLVWFTKTRRLRTFVAHIAESPKWRRRRGHELYKRKAEDVNRSRLGQRRPNGVLFDDDNHRLSQRPNGGLFNEDGIIEIDTDEDESDDDLYEDDRSVGDQPHGNQQGGNQEPGQARLTGPQLLKRRTARQPNSRMYRSMRTVQGMDNIYQLRGMKWVRFKDRNGDEHRQSIRDWSFIKDINTVVTLPKQPEHALKSQLENLTPLTGLQDWIPAEQDMRIIKMFYNEAPTVDLVGGSDTSGSVGGPSDGSDGGSDGDSSSDGDIHPCDPHHGDGDNSSGGDDHPNNGDGMDVDARSSRSSSNDLFVRSGSGSPGPRSAPMDGMELDPDYPNGPSGNGDGGMLNEADSISGLFVSSRSGSAPPSEPIIIDLTGEVTDDEEEGVSPPSEWSEQVKSESEPDQALGGQTSEMSLNDDPDPDPAQDSESDRGFDREESPPDSDDESDIENYSVSSSSSKRPSDGGGGPSKRPRFN